jgi:lipoprotein-releasing system permease protein
MISFTGHLQVTKFNLSGSYEEEPISVHNRLLENHHAIDYVTHVQKYAHKAGLIKANDEVMGILIKGVGQDFDLERFGPNIIEGNFISLSDTADSKEILISKQTSLRLGLGVGDDALVYFVQNPPRVRKLIVSGIYQTGMEDFDEKIVIGDLKLVQTIQNWPDTLIGGMEVFVRDFDRVQEYQEKLYKVVDYDHYVEKVNDKYEEIFDWLALLNRNVVIFLSLTLFVACFNMISILLILIMERTKMIGSLKAMGASNGVIRRIFIYNGMHLILKGLLIGNAIGIGFGLLQQHLKIFKLDTETYYMDYVPIAWNWEVILLLNLLTFVVVSAVLIIPTLIISRILPIKAIRFD